MKPIRRSDLDAAAESVGLRVQHDCGGFRLVQWASSAMGKGWAGNRYVFPDTGICPTATKRQCWIFLSGYMAGKHS